MKKKLLYSKNRLNLDKNVSKFNFSFDAKGVLIKTLSTHLEF